MKSFFYLLFVLTVSSYTYSQITTFDNLPISRVLIFNPNDHQVIADALTVPAGKLWYIQQIGPIDYEGFVSVSDDYPPLIVGKGGVLPEGTIVYKGANNNGVSLNIIEYDLNAQTISLNTNNIKSDNKIQLFPNPTNSRLSLNSDKNYNIEVFDLNGRKIMEVEGNNLDMSNLSKATYIVKAFDKASKETYSYKVIRN